MSLAQELRLDVGWGSLSALSWPQAGKPRILCLHGWMDNAASFVPLAPSLSDFDLVALESAGHGHSDHRPRGAHYYLPDYVFDLDSALDALNWDQCILVGHSLGATVASMFSSASPGRVKKLVMLDSGGALSAKPGKTVERLATSLEHVRSPRQHRRTYPDIESAARRRMAGNPMAENSAFLLAERALRKSTDGYQWRTDAGLMWRSPILPAEEQARDFLAGIRCPVLTITTQVLHDFMGEALETRLSGISCGTTEKVAGGHHVHMDEPGSVARLILDFLNSN